MVFFLFSNHSRLESPVAVPTAVDVNEHDEDLDGLGSAEAATRL